MPENITKSQSFLRKIIKGMTNSLIELAGGKELQPEVSATERTKDELTQHALAMESLVIKQLQRITAGSSTDFEHIEIQMILHDLLSTPGFDSLIEIETSRTEPRLTRVERRAPKAGPNFEKNNPEFFRELAIYVSEHKTAAMYSQFVFLAEGEIPTYLDLDVFHRETNTRTYTFIILEQLPAIEMSNFIAELKAKEILSQYPQPVKLAKQGQSFSFGDLNQGTYQPFKLWNSFQIGDRKYYAFLSIADREHFDRDKKSRTPKKKRESTSKRQNGFLPEVSPARS